MLSPMLFNVCILLEDIELRILGSPEVGFFYRGGRFFLRVVWTNPLMNFQYEFHKLDLLHATNIPENEQRRYLEAIIHTINKKYRDRVEEEIAASQKRR